MSPSLTQMMNGSTTPAPISSDGLLMKLMSNQRILLIGFFLSRQRSGK